MLPLVDPDWAHSALFLKSSINSVASLLFELPLGIWFSRFKFSFKLQLDEAIKLAYAQKTVDAENMAGSGSWDPDWKKAWGSEFREN